MNCYCKALTAALERLLAEEPGHAGAKAREDARALLREVEHG